MMKPIKQIPIRDMIYSEILKRILRGELKPGSKVRDFQLAEQLMVSRTPVRETLLRLEFEGYVKNHMGRGFVISPLTCREVMEIYPILWTLESFALDSSTPLSPTQQDRLRTLCKKMDIKSGSPVVCIDLDADWHSTLLVNCQNKQLIDIIESLRARIRRYEYVYMLNLDLIQSSISDHEKILELIKKGEGEKAANFLKNHWERSFDFLLDRLRDEDKT